MKKSQKILLGVGAAILVIGGAAFFFLRGKKEDEVVTDTDDGTRAGENKALPPDYANDVDSTVGQGGNNVIAPVTNPPIVSRPLSTSSLPIRVISPTLNPSQLFAWETVSIVERVAPKGGGSYVLTFKNRKDGTYPLSAGQQIAVEISNAVGKPLKGLHRVEKVWVDANGKKAGVFIRLIPRGGFGAISSINATDARFRADEYAADGKMIVLKRK